MAYNSIPNDNYTDYDYLATLESGQMTPNASSSGLNYASYIPAVTTLLGTAAQIEDIKAKNDATLRNMENAAKTAKHSQFQKSQQIDDITRVVGDQLSDSGLEAMKREATLRAASAETGGEASAEVLQTAFVEENFRNAQIMRDGEVAKANTMMSMVTDRLSLDNQLDSMKYGMDSSLSAFLQTTNASVQGFNTGSSMLSTYDKNALYGVDTTGTRTT